MLKNTVDDAKGEIILTGDLNGRVDNAVTDYENFLRPPWKTRKDAEGKRILQFSLANNLKILNTCLLYTSRCV